MFICGILFPGYFSTDLKCVRNATFFLGLFFSLPYKQCAQNKVLGREQIREPQNMRAPRASGNFKLYLFKVWLHVLFESARDCAESRMEQLQVPTSLARGSLREQPPKGTFPIRDVVGWSGLSCCFPGPCCAFLVPACAWAFFHKRISVILLEENYFAGTILCHLNSLSWLTRRV